MRLRNMFDIIDNNGNPVDIKGYKIGSVAYQNAMLDSILYKCANGIPLTGLEEEFIEIQGEFCNYPFREIVTRIQKIVREAK